MSAMIEAWAVVDADGEILNFNKFQNYAEESVRRYRVSKGVRNDARIVRLISAEDVGKCFDAIGDLPFRSNGMDAACQVMQLIDKWRKKNGV